MTRGADPRYRFSLCGIAKDEDPYLVEWVAYHLSLGFEHIYLYDNMSRTPIEAHFDPALLGRRLTVIRWENIPKVDVQLKAYEHFVQTRLHETEWVMVLDLDEFLVLRQDPDIARFVARFPDADAVSVNWRIFGSGGALTYEPRPMIERFRRCAAVDFDGNHNIKTLHRTRHLNCLSIHHGLYSRPVVVRASDGRETGNSNFVVPTQAGYDVAQVNHYFIKSREEWDWKRRRGYPLEGYQREDSMFDVYDRNELQDDFAFLQSDRIRAGMQAVARKAGT